LLPEDEDFSSHHRIQHTCGEPDLILRASNTLLAAVEVKTKWALNVDDLVNAFNNNPPQYIINIVRQVFGYLQHNKLQYGALTTYDKTWFLHRQLESPNELRISPVIRCDGSQPTLFQGFAHFAYLARNAQPFPPLAPSPRHNTKTPPDDDDSGPERKIRKVGGRGLKKGKRRRTPKAGGGGMTTRSHNRPQNHASLDFFDWGSFEVLDVLGIGRSGKVFKALLHGEEVAFKLCDLWQHPELKSELLNEVKVYHALKDLQGVCIPKFKSAGYTAGGLFGIATEVVGESLGDEERLSGKERQVIQRALTSIHRHGFMHGDIRRENIRISRSGGRFNAFFIDFGFSKPGCEKDFREETKVLEAELLSFG
jgi:tRNA A-37 threonylcarbamoyl transferase component Bud32